MKTKRKLIPGQPGTIKSHPLQLIIGEIHLRKIVKAAGGKWNKGKNTGELPFNKVIGSGLKERIIAQ